MIGQHLLIALSAGHPEGFARQQQHDHNSSIRNNTKSVGMGNNSIDMSITSIITIMMAKTITATTTTSTTTAVAASIAAAALC
jgi:hypothetical protein